jgi:hypothetical protein
MGRYRKILRRKISKRKLPTWISKEKSICNMARGPSFYIAADNSENVPITAIESPDKDLDNEFAQPWKVLSSIK